MKNPITHKLSLLLWILGMIFPSFAYQHIPSKSRASTNQIHSLNDIPSSIRGLSGLHKPFPSISTSSSHIRHQSRRNIHRYQRLFRLQAMNSDSNKNKPETSSPVTVSIPLGPGYDSMTYQFRPLFQNSTFIVVTYQIPFDLSLDRPPKGFPAPIVTKDNVANDPLREKQGDVLRATTSWSQSYLTGNGGWASDIVNVAGNVKWKRAIFDTVSAPWDEVIKALQSNIDRSDEVTLVFERALENDINDNI